LTPEGAEVTGVGTEGWFIVAASGVAWGTL
jgi:hypothetical protein